LHGVLAYAKAQGGTDCAVEISEGSGLSVSVRKSKIETIEQNKDKGMGVTVFIGQRRGNASTSDFSPAALKATVEAAYNIARFTADDDCAGLADADQLERAARPAAVLSVVDCDRGSGGAGAARAAAFAVDPRITNSEGAGVHVQQSHFVSANSRGFIGGYPYSRHTCRWRRLPARAPICSATTGIRRCAMRPRCRRRKPSAVMRPSARWRA
jgi:PmbA protein